MKSTIFLAMLTTISLLACGKAEEVAAPVPVAASELLQQGDQMPVSSDEPVALAAEPVTPVVKPDPAPPPVEAPAIPTVPAKPAATRAAPIAGAVVAAATPVASEKPDLTHGQKIYGQACAFCHDKGVAGAPKSGDAAAWSPRLAQGIDVLHASALLGKGVMPAKGGNPALADADVRAAVDFLVAQTR